jgi:CHASE3 domain sensor protein
MDDSKKTLRKKIILSFSVMIILILGSGVLGWFLTQQIERSGKIIERVHLFKEAELQLRREEKNLLIRGYSQQRYLRWQKAKEDFHRLFGELIGLNALTGNEINNLKEEYTEMSDTYNKFFDDIRTTKLSEDEILKYDSQFKTIGRKTLEMINTILTREQEVETKNNLGTDIVIVIFIIIFIATAAFLIINVLKHL